MWKRKRGRDLLRPHERLVFDAMRDRLEPAAVTLLDAQLARIEMVQRHQDGREVNLYPNLGDRSATSWTLRSRIEPSSFASRP